MTWVEVGGTDIHYIEAGGDTPLVLLHGFGSCGEAWHRQLHHFADRYRVIAYDSADTHDAIVDEFLAGAPS